MASSACVNPHVGMIPGFELKRVLQRKQAQWKTQQAATNSDDQQRQREHKAGLRNRNWVSNQVVKFLEMLPANDQSQEVADGFLAALDALQAEDPALELMPSEKLQLLDVRPCSPAEVHRVIECCDERLSEEQVCALLDLLNEHVPAPNYDPEDGEGEAAAAGAEQEEGPGELGEQSAKAMDVDT